MTLPILLPFLFGTAVIALAGVMMLYDPFRVGANLAQMSLSMFLSSMLSWALWITGNVIIISFYPLSVPAWETNVILAMIIGPVVVRAVIGRVALSYDTPMERVVMMTLAGSIAGALIGRFILADQFERGYVGVGLPGTARIMWVWLGAIFGSHAYAVYIAFDNVMKRREP